MRRRKLFFFFFPFSALEAFPGQLPSVPSFKLRVLVLSELQRISTLKELNPSNYLCIKDRDKRNPSTRRIHRDNM